MRITAISDMHGHLPQIEPCDLLLIAGDICPLRDHSPLGQLKFLVGPFNDWLRAVPATHIIGVAGNHDFLFQRNPDLVPKTLPWHYLQDSSIQLAGFNIYGTPWQPWFYDWAFNLQEEELVRKWAMIPDNTDILICHGPPHGYGDTTRNNEHVGSPSLLETIRRIKPKLCIFGHIHEAHGRWTLDNTELANVSIVNSAYTPAYPPTTFDIDPPGP